MVDDDVKSDDWQKDYSNNLDETEEETLENAADNIESDHMATPFRMEAPNYCPPNSDIPVSNEAPTVTITVRQFLIALGGQKLVRKVGLSKVGKSDQDDFLNGLVSLNNFGYVTGAIDFKSLPLFFYRGQGIFCKRGQKDCDLIIPVFFYDSEIGRWKFSYILVSVKNYANRSTESKMAVKCVESLPTKMIFLI